MNKAKPKRIRKPIFIILFIFLVLFSFSLFFIIGENTAMKKMFLSEVKTEIAKCKISNDIFKEEDISRLPEPVKNYFRYCGYIGKEKMSKANFIWKDVTFKMSQDKPWFKIKYQQYNFVNEPSRIAYIYSKMFGIIPFEGRDQYLNGKGNMIGKLFKKITLFNVVGDQINISAAVTYLSESLIVPSCALQPYIKWEAIDENHSKATIKYKNIKASGIFSFNNKGEFTKFETEERYMDTGNGTSEKHKWTAVASDYLEKNGIKYPSKLKGIWNLQTGDYKYFDGTISEIIY